MNTVTVLAIQMMRRNPANFPGVRQDIPYTIVTLVFDETDSARIQERFIDPIHAAFENLLSDGSVDYRQARFYLPEVADGDHLHKFFRLLQEAGAILIFSNAAEM